MRTETVTRTIYTYAELMDSEQVSQRAKEKASEWLQSGTYNPELVTESLENSAQAVLGDKAYVKIRGWDADRGQSVEFDAEFWTPLPEHGWDDAPTLDLPGEYQVIINGNVRRIYEWEFAVCYLGEDGVLWYAGREDDEGIYEKVGDFLREFESWLVSLAVSEIEWMLSDEAIANYAEDGGFEFDADGDPVFV